jgi:pterin-4a-carbinolamine dehydratase
VKRYPDVDLRYDGVTVRLSTRDVEGISERDVELAGACPARLDELLSLSLRVHCSRRLAF